MNFIFAQCIICAFSAVQMMAQNERTNVMEVITNKPWVAQTNKLYQSSGSVVPINTKIKSYGLEKGQNIKFEIPAEAISDERTGNVWIGRQAQFYIETDSGIVGVSLPLGPALRWDKGLINKVKSHESIEEAIHRFETEVPTTLLQDISRDVTGLSPFLNFQFFDAVPGSSQPATTKITKIGVSKGVLELGLESPSGVFKAVVWIDIKTHKVVKATEDGRQVFPK